MQVKINYSLGFTRNLGNFNNIKPEYSLEVIADVDSLDDADELKAKVEDKVDEWLFATLDDVVAQMQEKIE